MSPCCSADLKRPEEALPLLRRAALLSKATTGAVHPQYATALSNLAGALTQLGRPSEAQPHLKRALSISRKALGKEHKRTKAAASSLKACQAAIKAAGASSAP